MLFQRLQDGLPLDFLQLLGVAGGRGGRQSAASRTRVGRCSGKISSLRESNTARSIALRNSRTLPGHGYRSRQAETVSEKRARPLVNSSMNRPASGKMSSRRSRNGGTSVPPRSNGKTNPRETGRP